MLDSINVQFVSNIQTKALFSQKRIQLSLQFVKEQIEKVMSEIP